MNRHNALFGAEWALTVAKQAITLVAAKLLSSAILSVLVKTWPALALMTGAC
ncbi:TPA: hypothetical protein RQN12_002679 [Aeromonas dhakensis]|nr:hypothetical protein [Aeromonas dhakensis]